ncbi:MAG: hypothetical protein Q8S43_11150 [Actinomycetota bacterium]|nr:MAG: hypothetical protein FD171_2204 [Actinomycetota bacterium]MDP3631490.1 hypothetical protein [Actinomycetota bacterium]
MGVRKQVSQLVGANRLKVMQATAYETIPQWSKKFRDLEVLERDGDTVTARLDTRVMGIPLTAWVTGIWGDDRVVEEIRLSDGTVTEETVVYTEVPEGTLVQWTGAIVRPGKWTKLLGPLMGTAFALDVKRDFRALAAHMASLEATSNRPGVADSE